MQKRGCAGVFAVFFLVLLQSVLLTGCGQSGTGEQVTELQIDKNGGVTGTIVEAFDKEYYTLDGLEAMIQSEMTEYNRSGEKISLKKAELSEDGSTVTVVMHYVSCEDYTAFNEEELFYGTIAEALKKGYTFDTKFVKTSGETLALSKEALEEMAEKHVLIVRESIQVSLPAKVLYMTEGTVSVNNKCIQAQNASGLTYVIMK